MSAKHGSDTGRTLSAIGLTWDCLLRPAHWSFPWLQALRRARRKSRIHQPSNRSQLFSKQSQGQKPNPIHIQDGQLNVPFSQLGLPVTGRGASQSLEATSKKPKPKQTRTSWASHGHPAVTIPEWPLLLSRLKGRGSSLSSITGVARFLRRESPPSSSSSQATIELPWGLSSMAAAPAEPAPKTPSLPSVPTAGCSGSLPTTETSQ